MRKLKFISLKRKQTGLLILSVLFIIAGVFWAKDNIWIKLWNNFVYLNWYFLLLALSGLLLYSLLSIIPNNWFEPIRNQALQQSFSMKYLLFSFLVLFATSHFFHDRQIESVFHDIWFNPVFLLLRAMIIMLSWYAYANQFSLYSKSWSEKIRKRKSIEFLLVFIFTFSLFSWDWLMSIHVDYSSALFSFYMLVSALLMGCGFLLVRMHRNKQIHPYSNDLGRLTLAFSLFWLYLYFSQLLIAWFTAIPHEIAYYHLLFQPKFLPFLVISAGGNFILPFLLLLSKKNRQSPKILLWAGISILLAKWFEIYLLVAPYNSNSISSLPLMEIGFILLAGLGLVLLLDRFNRKE